MPSDTMLKTMNALHHGLLKVTGGRFGWSGAGMPVIELTTIGRKSGEPRTVMLTAPIAEGGTYTVVASRGGDPVHPAWFHNLVANPTVTVKDRAGTRTMHARVMTSEERAEPWARIAARYKNYAGYQTKTTREIPLVVLTPEVAS